jgi:hypothetical protein
MRDELAEGLQDVYIRFMRLEANADLPMDEIAASQKRKEELEVKKAIGDDVPDLPMPADDDLNRMNDDQQQPMDMIDGQQDGTELQQPPGGPVPSQDKDKKDEKAPASQDQGILDEEAIGELAAETKKQIQDDEATRKFWDERPGAALDMSEGDGKAQKADGSQANGSQSKMPVHGWSKRTDKMQNLLTREFKELEKKEGKRKSGAGVADPQLSLNKLIDKKPRKVAAGIFYQLLVLKGVGAIDVHQAKYTDQDPFPEILITKGDNLDVRRSQSSHSGH